MLISTEFVSFLLTFFLLFSLKTLRRMLALRHSLGVVYCTCVVVFIKSLCRIWTQKVLARVKFIGIESWRLCWSLVVIWVFLALCCSTFCGSEELQTCSCPFVWTLRQCSRIWADHLLSSTDTEQVSSMGLRDKPVIWLKSCRELRLCGKMSWTLFCVIEADT